MSSLQRYPGLDAYWPALNEVNAIATEAEALDDAVLMAVHRDMQLIKRPFAGTGGAEHVTQEDLLDHVLNGLKPEGYLLIPVTGPSGAGKSHLVRWLEIRLKNHPKASQFRLVRVPKSASLRSVIEAILEPVSELPEYRELMVAVRDSTSALSPREATAMFGAMLSLALKEKAKEWQEPGAMGVVDGTPVSRLAGHADMLAAFVQDPVVAPHFLGTVYPRLLERALSGRRPDSANADRPPQFELQDLSLPAEMERDLQQAAQRTFVYYTARLGRQGGRNEALLALNAVIDATVARVFQLGQSLQGRTLQDILRDIREKLHEERKELVLLVEDFYALTGIQEQLLSLCIQGTMDVSAGGKPLCPIRTVMAMTDSTLDGRDTIKTRSEFHWSVLADQDNDAQVLQAVVELCGRYLNAARIGRAELRRRYDHLTGAIDVAFTPEHDDADSSDVLRAFGSTSEGFELFPLSESAIHFLARRTLTEGGRLIFKPRFALQRILLEVLKTRDSFVQSAFPVGLNIDESVSIELSPLVNKQPEHSRLRYQRLILCWGDDPRTEAELREMAPEVFMAFGLEPPFKTLPSKRTAAIPITGTTDAPPATTAVRSKSEKAKEPVPSSVPPRNTDPAELVNIEWREVLTNWSRGQRLTLDQSNKLRKRIVDHVKDFIDWHALCLSRDDFDQGCIQLPNALGHLHAHLPERPLIPVVGPSGKAEAESELALELLALLRFDGVKSFDYEDGENDSYRYYGLLDRIAARLERAALVAAQVKLAPMAHMALRNSSVRLGLSINATRIDRLNLCLEADDLQPQRTGVGPWDELRQSCWNQRQAMRDLVLRYIQVVQGKGETPYAVDGGRLACALNEPPPDVKALKSIREHDLAVTDPVKALLSNLGEARVKASAKEALKKVAQWKAIALDATALKGTEEEAAQVFKLSKDLISNATLSNCWPVPSQGAQAQWLNPKDQEAGAVRFASVSWPRLTTQVCLALEEGGDSMEAVLSTMPALPWDVMRQTQDFLAAQLALLAAVERKIEAEQRTLGAGGSQSTVITDVKAQLDSLAGALQAFVGDVE